MLNHLQESKYDQGRGRVTYNRGADAVNGIDNPAMDTWEVLAYVILILLPSQEYVVYLIIRACKYLLVFVLIRCI